MIETINTPCVKGSRIYVSTHHSIYPNRARLVAIDLDPNDKLKYVWHYEFGGRSGASPLLIDDTIYFDGHSGIKEAIFSNSHDDFYPQINDNGEVVWCRYEGDNYEIFLYDIYDKKTPKNISNNHYDDLFPQINNKGQVVWHGYDGKDYEIFLYNPDPNTDPNEQIIKTEIKTDNSYDDISPQINEKGEIVWCGHDGVDYEILVYHLSFAPPTPRQLSQPDNEMPTIFAVKDLGASCMELWTRRVSSTIEASFAKDPRGGFWYFLFEKEDLIRLGADGTFLQWIKLSKDILKKEPGEYWPYSVMTIAGEDPNNPIMIVSAKRCTFEEDPNCGKCTRGDTDGGAYVVAIDLVKEELKWKFKISDDPKDYTAGQFPIVFKEGKAPRVIFTNNNKGTYCIGTE